MYNNKTRKDSEGIVLRHPALTRFFAAFLAVVSVLTLISGGICIRKAADSREKQNTNTARLSEKTAEAKELCAEIAAAPVEFERQSAAYDEAKARYDSEKTSYRKDLSIYTATEAALKQGQEKLDEGYAALRTGWIQHDNGEKALDEAEAQFRPGYEQYLAGKKQLEEGRKQYAQAEKLKESLPELALVRAGLEAVKGSEGELSASLGAIRDTIQNPPRDDETDEIDPDVIKKNDNEFEVDGDLPIGEFLELVNIDEEDFEADSETVGGWVVEMLGHFPIAGESFTYQNIELEVLAMDGLRVEKILIRINHSES